MENNYTHIDKKGDVVMVDVRDKLVSHRTAMAGGEIKMSQECFRKIMENKIVKGDVLKVAQIAGIMATKRTDELIPLCHRLLILQSSIEFELEEENCTIYVKSTVSCNGKTGVEMEALTGVSVALLTIYDMCKAVDKHMIIKNIHLERKTGGKSGEFSFVNGSLEEC